MSTPYIGSKISLISKSEIRYEGILYTVDPKESTIALAKVRSFGTESRATETPMPPREDIYEYIIFKASDIKDLTVCETPQPAPQIYGGLPYDPAIVSVSKSSGHQIQSAPFSSSDMPPGSQLSGLAPKAAAAASGTSTRSETALDRDASPKTEMGVQTYNNNSSQNRAPGGGAGRQQTSRRSGGGQRTTSGSGGGANGQHGGGGGHQPQQHRQQRDSGRVSEGSGFGGGGFQPPRGGEIHNRGAFRYRGGMRRGGAGFGGGGNFFTPLSGPFFRGGGGGFHQQHGGRGGGGMSHQGGPSPFIYRGGFIPRGAGGGGQQHQPRRSSQSRVTANTLQQPQQPQQQRRASGGHALKFDSDYDWELANTQFQETLRLKDDGPTAKPEENKEQKKEEENVAGSDSPVVAADHNGGEHLDENKDKPPCYDKNKSFFDAISCEALERADGKNNRLNWRKERELNTETFGQVALRNYQFRRGGGFRGCGYAGRGFRRGYASGGQYRMAYPAFS